MPKKARLGTDYGKWSTRSIFSEVCFWISDFLLFYSAIAVHFLPNYLLNPSLDSFHILSSILSIHILFPYYVYTFPILRAGEIFVFSLLSRPSVHYTWGWVSDLSPLPPSSLKHCALNALSNRERIILTIASLLLIVFQFTPEGMTSVFPTPAHLDCLAALSIRCLSTSEHITRVAARVAFLFLAHFPMRRANHF